MKKLLLTGGTSLLGKALITKIPPHWKIILAEHTRKNVFPASKNLNTVSFDATDPKQVSHIISRHKPHLVIHAASLSNVDFCQKHPKEAWRINVEGTQNIVRACEENNIPLIFISSNAVFDGVNPPAGGYCEKDQPNPVNLYGQTKYEGEKIVQNSKIPWQIVRLITMYGWPPPQARQNPVTWALKKLKKGEKLKIVNDVYLNPLYNHDAACALWAIIEKGRPKNIYHIAGSEIVNRYQWTVQIAKVFGFPLSLVSPVSSSFFGGKIAPRPPQTIYSIEKIKRELGIDPRGIKDGLKAMENERK